MKYIRMHQVEAEPMTRGDYNKKRGWEIPANENPADEGYLVTYPDGYISWCPKAQFEAAGRPVDGMTFGMAVEMMKQGRKVARKGWNGDGQFVRFGSVLAFADGNNKNGVGHDITSDCLVFQFKNRHTGKTGVQVGWFPSQGDMKANDWVVVE